MGDNGRAKNGRFVPGNVGGPGRPRRTVEERYLRRLRRHLTKDAWDAIVTRAVQDAINGDRHAREWLGQYVLPKVETTRKVLGAVLHGHLEAEAATNPYANAPPQALVNAKIALAQLREASRNATVQDNG